MSAVPALGEMRLDRGRLGPGSAVDVVRDGAEHGAALGREPLEIDLRVAQDGAQADPRTRDDLSDGVGPDPELGSDLRVRVAFDLAKRQRTSLTTGQHRGATTDEVLLLEQQRRALGVVLEVVVRPGRHLDLAVCDLVIVATLLPQDVPGHRVQVAADVHVGRGLGEAGDEADQDLLHEVVSGGRIARQAQAAAAQLGRVALVERLQRLDAGRTGADLRRVRSYRHTRSLRRANSVSRVSSPIIAIVDDPLQPRATLAPPDALSERMLGTP